MRVPCLDCTSMLGQRPAFESRLSPKPARAFLMIYFVYILISQKDNSFYIGQTFYFNDTANTEIYTLSLHDALPISWKLFWFIQVPSRSEAMRLERNIKNLKSRKRILEFIRGKGNHSDIL